MFCWPCIIVHQYNETNVMHILFCLLRTKGLYMFRALLAHPQEALYKRYLVYCMRVIIPMQCTKCRLCIAAWGWTSNARNMQRPLILNKLNKKCITLVSLFWYRVMFSKGDEFQQVRCLTHDFRCFCYPPYSFSDMTHAQKEYVPVACHLDSYRQNKNIRNLFVTLPVKAMFT
jgi:ribosomal protein L33